MIEAVLLSCSCGTRDCRVGITAKLSDTCEKIELEISGENRSFGRITLTYDQAMMLAGALATMAKHG